jgi:succinate dehydrogenase flavin-adding protein (antitoxin of CptAB toxin-antitoxin module)
MEGVIGVEEFTALLDRPDGHILAWAESESEVKNALSGY